MNHEKWQQTRMKGKARFMWVSGFLVWGVSTAILWSILMHFIQPLEPTWVRPVIALVLFPLGGLGWAHFVWIKSEKKYAKHTGNS